MFHKYYFFNIQVEKYVEKCVEMWENVLKAVCFFKCVTRLLIGIKKDGIPVKCRQKNFLLYLFPVYFKSSSISSMRESNTFRASFIGWGDAISTPASLSNDIGSRVQPEERNFR